MAKTFGVAERNIVNLFKIGSKFLFNGSVYTVSTIGKPTCRLGEPKTDIYISAKNNVMHSIELKISFKKRNGEFLENKTTADRAEQLLGPSWNQVITSATKNLKDSFLERSLIYKRSFGRTSKGSITLGWKFELLNVNSGNLSGSMNLTRPQLIDVYAGTNLAADKKNASVNGIIVPNSGIANFILFEDEPITSMQSAIDSLKTIEEFIDVHPQVYFACKALNYRTFAKKYDGNRPLAVYVDWSVNNGKLHADLNFNSPLEYGGNFAYEKLLRAMKELNIKTTDDLSANNVTHPDIILG